MDNWIKIEDRLPEYRQAVDLWMVSIREPNKQYRFTSWTWERQDTVLQINGYKATHWMPVPPPPKPSQP